MKTNKNFSVEKDFVLNGRFTVTSFRTGKRYFVEPIENEHTPLWGDVNPATGKIEGSYGQKNKGGSREKESLITKENGFKNITYSGVGCSPFDVIDKLDAKYPTVVN
jgi:hypothetical protein